MSYRSFHWLRHENIHAIGRRRENLLGIGPAVGETERDWPGRRANSVLDKLMARCLKVPFRIFVAC